MRRSEPLPPASTAGLHGIPVSVKDLFYTRAVHTTAGPKIFADFVPDHDATVVKRLRSAGAVLLGKTNLHELAYGITSNNPHFGPARNPWRRSQIPGGSSGGSGPAVVASLCSASKCAPFFQTVQVIAAILRAKVRRAIEGFLPLASKAS